LFKVFCYFFESKLKLELHPEKSKIINLSQDWRFKINKNKMGKYI
jgi:hypothetical protein